jgi:diguanylate cyclase (GGDEF)-like protein
MPIGFGNMSAIPGVVALLLFFVFTYLYSQSRASYFRAWQLGWAAYSLHYALDTWMTLRRPSGAVFFLSQVLLFGMAFSVFISTRLTRKDFRWLWYDGVVAVSGIVLAAWNLYLHMQGGVFVLRAPLLLQASGRSPVEVGIALLFLFASLQFYRQAHGRQLVGLSLLAITLAFWAVLLGYDQLGSNGPAAVSLGQLLGPFPQMLLGISMVIVLFEIERRAVQENTLAFSSLGVDAGKLLDAPQLVPNIELILDRLLASVSAKRAMLCASEPWREVVPSVQRGFSPELLREFEASGGASYLCQLAFRRSGFVELRNLADLAEPVPALAGEGFENFRQVLLRHGIRDITAFSLQTREHNFGVVIFPGGVRRLFAASQVRMAVGLALQIAMTLENYITTHAAHRRTQEYELLTQIGQAVSSRLNQDEILRVIQKELGRLFDTSNFYVAFREGDEIRFELELENGVALPKRSRKTTNALTEYILRTRQPLLIRSDLERTRERLGVTYIPPRPALSLCGAPIFVGGQAAGVMVAMSCTQEFAFEQRDLEVMKTAAGQVSVAVENARLFAEEQRRSRQLAFLNNISKTAISSQDSEQMLAEIVQEIQETFQFDHIGIGILDYTTKDIEIRAEAGTTAHARGKRIPLGVGILGRVARSGETALVQSTDHNPALGILQDSRSVLCIPVSYGETLLGVLNIESKRESAFTPDDKLILGTLADLLATALHNSFVFQKLQRQSITDGLTGIKTRGFFLEAVQSEWKRASRSGRPFSVVLVDLDKFKEVNDSMGHLEGDLVLARVGRLLEQKCRQSNVVARYGGDEFIILMPETGMEQAQILSERLRLWVATDPMLNEHHISGSFGVASFPAHGFSVEDIIRLADEGMYISKRAGGNCVSNVELFASDEGVAVKRQMIASFVEGFLQRDHNGPEHVEEAVSALIRIGGVGDNCHVEVLQEAVEALARASESREAHAAGHSERIVRCAEMLGQALDFPPEEMADLLFAARVHDVGKLFLPEKILNKPGPLTEDEFYLMKLHPQMGCELLATLPASERLQSAVEHHHEAFDGSGYPAGLRGEQIPFLARIISLADAFVNMTSERPFAPAKTTEEALAELEKLSGTRYDGMLVRLLVRHLRAEKTTRA